MKKLVIGILAHVDSGKTTLSESMLYLSGSIKKQGRVDNKDAFLDNYRLERERGITIFSKQAQFQWQDTQITLVDTPGHIDFSAEMERTLQILDAAVLVISGSDGIQSHTRTLWKLLSKYRIPTILFINKMDQPGTEPESIGRQIRERLNDGCLPFDENAINDADWKENIAVCDENLLERYLETGKIEKEDIVRLIKGRKLFPCYFGSALRNQGVKELLQAITDYLEQPDYPAIFGARVFKIARDPQGNRLTYLKITGGLLRVKEMLSEEEKVNQIRIYSGDKYDTVSEVAAGSICAVTGPINTYPGQGLGQEVLTQLPVLTPVLTYRVIWPDDMDSVIVLGKLRELEEEEPELHVVWDSTLQEIQMQLMGEVQIEIIKSLIQERFGFKVEFGTGKIVYLETINKSVEAVGHFEPLRHYAEVHLKMEPGERGSGLHFYADCSTDALDRNWQRLILTHLEEKEHIGVLTGSPITDMKITLIGGKSHIKHTEGGDFREATYRAVRQGLMESDCILLEPWYEFRMELPKEMAGRALSDLDKFHGSYEPPVIEKDMTILVGSAPVSNMREYPLEFISYTRGRGHISVSLKGYYTCHNQEEVIEKIGYEPNRDLENPTGSVFCEHGAGFVVPWNEVKDHMHIPYIWNLDKGKINTSGKSEHDTIGENVTGSSIEKTIGLDEIEEIFTRTFRANSQDKAGWKKKQERGTQVIYSPVKETVLSKNAEEMEDRYLLVDGYNIIFAWKELKELAAITLDGARGKLMDILCNYQGFDRRKLILVFDAYRVEGHSDEILTYHNITVVYTREAETADQYIERTTHEIGRKHHVTVATSDGLEQIIIRGQGCFLISAREFQIEVEQVCQKRLDEFVEKQEKVRNLLGEYFE